MTIDAAAGRLGQAVHRVLEWVAAVAALQPGDAVRGAFVTGRGDVTEV